MFDPCDEFTVNPYPEVEYRMDEDENTLLLSGGSELPKIMARPRSSGVGSAGAGTKSLSCMFDLRVMIGMMKDSLEALP